MSDDERLDRRAKIYVAGHMGMAGSSIVRKLLANGYANLLLRSRAELDLRRQADVRDFLKAERPDVIVIAAARVGGIQANNVRRAEFLYENLVIETNLIEGAHNADVDRLLFLGSSCIYPRDCPQPIREEYLLSGPLEPTNEPYAIAKIAGIKLCESYASQYGRRYFSIMPTNLYGTNDNYDLESCHVLPALLRKAHEAKSTGSEHLFVWGTGRPRREFLHIDDLAAACVFLIERGYYGPMLNVGSSADLSIGELAERIARVVGFQGTLAFDATKPDGTPRKLLDSSKILGLGWAPAIDLDDGLRRTYAEFQATIAR